MDGEGECLDLVLGDDEGAEVLFSCLALRFSSVFGPKGNGVWL